jgi:hypothetical protein
MRIQPFIADPGPTVQKLGYTYLTGTYVIDVVLASYFILYEVVF